MAESEQDRLELGDRVRIADPDNDFHGHVGFITFMKGEFSEVTFRGHRTYAFESRQLEKIVNQPSAAEFNYSDFQSVSDADILVILRALNVAPMTLAVGAVIGRVQADINRRSMKTAGQPESIFQQAVEHPDNQVMRP